MTNEEAIEILRGVIKKPNTKDGYLEQAIDMAIKALEERTEIIKKIKEVSWEHTFYFENDESRTYEICALSTVLEILGELQNENFS